MNERVKELYRSMLSRSSKGMMVVIPILLLYMISLLSLNAAQLKAIGVIAITVYPVLFAIFTFQLRFNMSPIVAALEEKKTAPHDLVLAENRSLTIPYIIGVSAVFWFSVGGAITAWLLMQKAGISREQALYIMASAVTGGVGTGMLGFFFAKEPLEKVQEFIWELKGRAAERPPVFVPLFAKLVGFFTLALLLTTVFLGFLTHVTAGKAAAIETDKLRAGELKAVQSLAEVNGSDPYALSQILEKAGGRDEKFCLGAHDFSSSMCKTDSGPSAEALAVLAAAPFGVYVQEPATGWKWAWAPLGQGEHVLLMGYKPVRFRFWGVGLNEYFAKVAFVIAFIGIALGFIMAMDISRPLRNMSAKAAAIADGRAEDAVMVASEDEVGQLARSFNRTTKTLLNQIDLNRLLVRSIKDAVEALAPASESLVKIASEQYSGSMEQAGAAEEAATTSQEIAAVSKQIADNARDVSQAAENSLKHTLDGEERLKITEKNYDNINRKTKNIADAVLKLGELSKEIFGIVKIIEDISEQTNLLALNAAIEAAGAGEHGERFSVVAEEIRRLAQSTAQSTKQIHELVERMQGSVSFSIMQVEEGDKAVVAGRGAMEETAVIFADIFASANSSTPRLKEIGVMTSQQSTASGQMALTVEEMREKAREGSDAARKTQELVGEIENIVRILKSRLNV